MFKALVTFVRDTLSDTNGVGSFSRFGCAVLVTAYVAVMLWTRAIPERSDQFAIVLLSLYGANQVKAAVQGLASFRSQPSPTPPSGP